MRDIIGPHGMFMFGSFVSREDFNGHCQVVEMKRRIYDFGDAINYSFKNPNATLCTKDGRLIRGTIEDVQDKNNDPDGIGYMAVLTNPKGRYGTCVYANNFSWAEFDK